MCPKRNSVFINNFRFLSYFYFEIQPVNSVNADIRKNTMNIAAYKQIPMTREDKEWMMTIYDLRYKNFLFPGTIHCTIYALVLFVVLSVAFAIFGFMGSGGNGSSFVGSALHFAWHHKVILSVCLSALLCWLAYNTLVLPYKKDAEEGIKLIVPFTVDRKEYYPVTGQFFIKFEGNNQKHFEVDADTYNSCEEGGIMNREMAPNSKHIFMENDHVNVKIFSIQRDQYSRYGS